jgi:hypothetical protein
LNRLEISRKGNFLDVWLVYRNCNLLSVIGDPEQPAFPLYGELLASIRSGVQHTLKGAGLDGHTICAITLGGVSERVRDCARTYCRSKRIGRRDNGHERLPRLTSPIAIVDDLTFSGELAEVGLADWDGEVSIAVLLEPGRCDQANLSTKGLRLLWLAVASEIIRSSHLLSNAVKNLRQ